MTAHPFPGALGDDEGWMHVDSKHGGYSVFTKHIERSQQDDREYRLIRLDNGLQAMLVHDAKADKAAASIDVGVGHLHDPDDMPGLAHFCEHLLFMGTEQFPKENEYSEYLSRNSGHSNAFTSTMNTNYYFNVAPGALAGAIQRFAGFFHSPLFDPSCTLRELNAVDSEHKKNHQADLWRIYQVNKTLSRPGHPWNKFGTGNKESLTRVGRELKAKQAQAASSSTNLKKQALSASNSAAQSLAPSAVPSRAVSPAPSVSSVSSDVEADGGVVGRETRRRLVEWWSKEYCAGRMRLAVIGKDSLDDLTELVIENFSPILNRGQEPLPLILQNPFGENEKGTLVSVQTIMNFHCMEISWPLEWQPPLWQTKPGLHLSDLLGHEGPGSLHSFLKSQGWITELVAGPQALARGFQMFRVTVHMTADGFQHYRDIMLAVFNYISLIKSSTMELWHQHELAQISDIRFRFQEKRQPQDTAVSLSQQLAMPYPRELVIKAGTVNLPWDSANGEGLAAAQRLLESLKVEECRTVLMGRKDEHDKVAGEQEWQTEPIYGTQYRVQRYDQDFMREAVAPNTNKAFALPKPNDFIPQNLEVDKKKVPEPAKRPQLIKETPLYSLWHKKDDRYWVPKAHALIELRTPIVNDTPRHNVLAKLYTELVTDSLTEYAYAADLAGLAYNFINSSTGIYLFISGYNDKLHVLLKAILERAKTLQVKEDRLDVIRERLERDWKNFFLNQSYKISDYYGRYAMNKNQWTVDEKLAVLPTVTVADVQNFIADFSSSYKALILVSGNVYKEDALNYAKTVEDVLGGSPLSGPDPHDVVLLLPEGCNYVWEGPVPNKDEPNSALTYYVHFGEHIDPRTRVRDALLTQIMSEPAFNVLRTKEQLGYIVSAGQWIAPGQAYAGLRIIVQSERGPVYLENRVEAFLDHMKTLLEEIPDGEFQEQKEGLKNKWLEKPKNLNEEVSRYWNHIDNGFHDFLRRENDAALLDEISKEEILAHFMKHVHPSSSTRSKLSLHLRSQKPRAGHISRPAADAFEVAAREAGVPVDDVEWRELYADGEPTAAEFGKFWQTQPSLASVAPAVAAQLLGKMQELVVELPAEKDAEGVLPEGVTRIDDLETFRQTLKEASLPKKPLVEWNDLPAPHL